MNEQMNEKCSIRFLFVSVHNENVKSFLKHLLTSSKNVRTTRLMSLSFGKSSIDIVIELPGSSGSLR